MTDLEKVSDYAYLWDGSQPGWVLNRLYGHNVELTLKFGPTGPSNGELMAVRRAVSEFKSLPLSQVIVRLRGCLVLSLGRFLSDQARKIAAECRLEGLAVVEEIISTPRFIPTNEIDGTVLIIEDNLLAKEVFAAAVHNGMPVRCTEI